MKPLVLHSFLKQKARQLQKKALSWHQALDEAARQLGYSNYKNYLNILEANRKQPKPFIDILLKNISSENNMSKKMDLAVSFIQSFKIPFHEQLDILKLFQHSHDLGQHPEFEGLDDVHFVCDKLNLMKHEIQSYLFNDFLTEEGEGDIHELYPYFIAKELSVSDITYEIKEDTIYADGNYHLTVKFGSEVPEHYKEHPDFQNGKLGGMFGITIDKDQKMTIDHLDIG